MHTIRRTLAPLVVGYPIDVADVADGLFDRPDCAPLGELVPGPGLGLVQIGTWEEEEHHPGPVYLDLDPRRLRAGRLDVLFDGLHYGPVARLPHTLSAWTTGTSSAAQAASLRSLWAAGHRSAAVCRRLVAYTALGHPSPRMAFRSPQARALLEAGLADDGLSMALCYEFYSRFKGAYTEEATARLSLPLLEAHTWSRGDVDLDALRVALRVSYSHHPEIFGELAPLASDYGPVALLAAVSSVSDPERALRLAVDLAHDTRRTDTELDSILRPLAAGSREPIWSRLCEFRS